MANEDLGRLKIEKGTAAGPGKRMRPLLVAIIILAAVIAAVALTGIITPKTEVRTAAASMVYPSQTFTKLNASGYVVAQKKSAVAAKVTGRLVWLGVKEGDKIKAGQVIAKLESQDVRAAQSQANANLSVSRDSLGQAKAELHDSQLNLKRMKELLAKGFVARSDFDTAEARYKKADAAVKAGQSTINASEAALKGAAVSVEYTYIRAPFDAVVLTKNADVGDIVTPIGASTESKAAVVTIADMDSLQVEADVSESNLTQVAVGQPCEIQLDALPDRRFKGEVATIVPTADRTKASVLVKVKFIERDQRVLPEMSAKAAFLERDVKPGEREPRLAVNTQAVVNRGGRQVVFVVKDGKASLREVITGEKLGDWVEVKSGLKSGDKVVINPAEKLKDGSTVKEAEL
ncbi:MAG TPA: efflux RND transporter periplasmic adaptor subunit [Nitrospirota bacterium]